jgi:thioredoxin reductase (NADPH)
MITSAPNVIVVGAGVAGMTAAIYGARAGLNVLVLEKASCGGLANSSSNVENFPSYQGIRGTELTERIRTQVESLDVAIEELTEVVDLDLASPRKVVHTDAGRFAAPALIVATGASPVRLPIQSDCDDRIHYCALCDGPPYAGREVVVVGGGNTGFDESLHLVNLGVESVVIVECMKVCAADQVLQRRARATGRIFVRTASMVRAIVQDGSRVRVTIEDLAGAFSEDVPADGVFVFIGQKPNTAILKGKVALDHAGYIVADALMHTDCPGVFAAGDVVAKKYRQLTTAMADGTVAALEAARHVREPVEGGRGLPANGKESAGRSSAACTADGRRP